MERPVLGGSFNVVAAVDVAVAAVVAVAAIAGATVAGCYFCFCWCCRSASEVVAGNQQTITRNKQQTQAATVL